VIDVMLNHCPQIVGIDKRLWNLTDEALPSTFPKNEVKAVD